MNILSLLKKNATLIAVVVFVGLYIVISGTTGSCPSCVYITKAIGLPSLATSSPATVAEPIPEEPLGVGDNIPGGVLFDEDGVSSVNVAQTIKESRRILVANILPICLHPLKVLKKVFDTFRTFNLLIKKNT